MWCECCKTCIKRYRSKQELRSECSLLLTLSMPISSGKEYHGGAHGANAGIGPVHGRNPCRSSRCTGRSTKPNSSTLVLDFRKSSPVCMASCLLKCSHARTCSLSLCGKVCGRAVPPSYTATHHPPPTQPLLHLPFFVSNLRAHPHPLPTAYYLHAHVHTCVRWDDMRDLRRPDGHVPPSLCTGETLAGGNAY